MFCSMFCSLFSYSLLAILLSFYLSSCKSFFELIYFSSIFITLIHHGIRAGPLIHLLRCSFRYTAPPLLAPIFSVVAAAAPKSKTTAPVTAPTASPPTAVSAPPTPAVATPTSSLVALTPVTSPPAPVPASALHLYQHRQILLL